MIELLKKVNLYIGFDAEQLGRLGAAIQSKNVALFDISE